MSTGTGFPGSRRRRRGGGSWTPQQLFGPNDVGLWYDYAAVTPEMLAWRRNLLLRSEEFDNAAWVQTAINAFGSGSVANTTATTDPLGGNTADYIQENTVNTTHGNNQGTVVVGVTYSFSLYAKQAQRSWIRLNVGGRNAWFNINAGTVGTVDSGATASIQLVGNGWYRCIITAVSTTTTGGAIRIQTANNETSYTGDGTSGLYVWGAQLELGSSATAYQRITDFTSDFLAAFPTTAIYQDSTGVTPVTALGQPVGLVLDKSRGGLSNVGPEVVTNGDFGTDSVWTKGTGWTIGSGVATHAGGVSAGLTQSVSTAAGTTYQVLITISGWNGLGVVTTQLYGGGGSESFNLSANGTYVRYITTTIARNTFGVFTASGWDGSIDNISVREVPGNHAIQSTPTARPVWDARKNPLVATENIPASSSWAKINTSSSTPTIVGPDGVTTVNATLAGAVTSLGVYVGTATGLFSTGDRTLSVYAKAGTQQFLQLLTVVSSGFAAHANFDLVNGVLGTKGSQVSVHTIESVGNGWYRCSATFPSTTIGSNGSFRFVFVQSASASYAQNITTSGTETLYLWGAQLELGSTATSYQRVTTATDYADVGFSRGALFDGSDDFLVTAANLVMSSTDEVTVIAGVDKRSDATRAMVVELTVNAQPNSGFLLDTSDSGSVGPTNYRFIAAGSAPVFTNAGAVSAPSPAPNTSVLSSLGDISADSLTIRLNGVATTTGANNLGTGNFANALLYLGRRAGTSLPLNGRITQLIIIGRILSAAEIAQVERYVATQSGVLIP